jgi:predicted nuclease of restriction endonuclease-like (RecB) superfamily
MTKALQSSPGYAALLKDIKERVRTAQMRATLAVNRELILLYWSIGRDVLNRQQAEGWGTKVIDRLAKDLGAEFPGVEGFSPRSLKYMRTFAGEWPDESIVQQVAAQLPWGHHMVLLDRIKNRTTREWYLQSAVEHGWSRNVLVHQISSRLHERQGKALSNFSRALPPEGSDLAEQILKDPYNFDFPTLTESAKERELERGLLIHLRDLLLELGRGFAFIGSQVPLEVDGQTFYLDLLLSCPAALLFSDRAQGRTVQTRVRGQIELLPLRSGYSTANPLRCANPGTAPLRKPWQIYCRIRPSGRWQTHWRIDLPSHPPAPRATAGRNSFH